MAAKTIKEVLEYFVKIGGKGRLAGGAHMAQAARHYLARGAGEQTRWLFTLPKDNVEKFFQNWARRTGFSDTKKAFDIEGRRLRDVGETMVENGRTRAGMSEGGLRWNHAPDDYESVFYTHFGMVRKGDDVWIDMVFAPVADVNTANTNPIIATRSFGDDPHDVAARASAFAAGLAEGGVLAVAKHCPGHGSTVQDSHDVLARVTRTLEELESIDLVPFRTLIAEGIAGIMVGHLEVPALDPVSGRPATASPTVVLDHLRHRLGYDGLVITDAMDMGGFPRAEAAALDVLQSGLDVLLMPSDPLATARSLHEAHLKGWLADETLDAAVAHIDRATERLAERASASRQPRPDLPEALLEGSLTTGSTPLPRLTAGQPVLVDVFGDDSSGIVAPSFRESLEAAGMIDGAGGMTVGLVLTSVAAHLGRSRLGERPRKRLAWALEHGKLDVVVVLGSPYELLALPEQIPALLAYEATPAAAVQAVRVLMGSASAPGLLPVGQGS